MLLLHNKHQQ